MRAANPSRPIPAAARPSRASHRRATLPHWTQAIRRQSPPLGCARPRPRAHGRPSMSPCRPARAGGATPIAGLGTKSAEPPAGQQIRPAALGATDCGLGRCNGGAVQSDPRKTRNPAPPGRRRMDHSDGWPYIAEYLAPPKPLESLQNDVLPPDRAPKSTISSSRRPRCGPAFLAPRSTTPTIWCAFQPCVTGKLQPVSTTLRAVRSMTPRQYLQGKSWSEKYIRSDLLPFANTGF